jgi:hypothetical protein
MGVVYSIQGGINNVTFAASSTYHLGVYTGAISTADIGKNYTVVPFAGTLTGFCVQTRIDANPLTTNTNITAVIRKNFATDYGTTITQDWAATGEAVTQCTSASTLVVAAGDAITLKLTTPASGQSATQVYVHWAATVREDQ